MAIRSKLFIFLGFFLILFLLWFIYWGLSFSNLVLIFNPHQVTPVSPLYYIKIARESVQSKFVFGDEDLSFWDYTIAKKRLEEAQTLQKYHLLKVSQHQLVIAKSYQESGNNHLSKLIDKTDVNFLIKLRDDNQKVIDSLSYD